MYQRDIRHFITGATNRSTASSIIEDNNYLNGPGINHVHKLLLETAAGKGILKAYAADEKLHKNKRSLLTRLVYAFEMNKAVKPVSITGKRARLSDFQISDDRWLELSRQIVKLFPNENRLVYDDPYHWKPYGNRRGGKLRAHHAYAKGVMRKDKLIKESPIMRKRKSKNSTKRREINENNNLIVMIPTKSEIIEN